MCESIYNAHNFGEFIFKKKFAFSKRASIYTHK